jgi:hypothetical protein
MSLIHFTTGASLLLFLMSAFGAMTWRQRLARRAFVLSLAMLIPMVAVLAEGYFWR